MMIDRNMPTFAGLEIEAFDKTVGIRNPAAAIRLEVDWDAAEEGETMTGLFENFLADARSSQVQALIIGAWEECYDQSIQPLVDILVERKDKLPHLKALFVGDMEAEECEISWIVQADYSALWSAFPQLIHFQVRGGNGLALGKLEHVNLRTLIIETGGLPPRALNDVLNCALPALEHLELWLGDDNYGWNSEIKDLAPLLSAEKFPKLKVLGLRNGMNGDVLAAMVVASDFVSQLDVLDLSLGTVGDVGAEALLASEPIKHLKKLDIHYHYIGEKNCAKLRALGIEVDLSEPQGEEDEEERYVAISE